MSVPEAGPADPTCPSCASDQLWLKTVPAPGHRPGEPRFVDLLACARCGHTLDTLPANGSTEPETPCRSTDAPKEPPRPRLRQRGRASSTPAVVAFLLSLLCFAVAYTSSERADRADRQAARRADAVNSLNIDVARWSGSSTVAPMRDGEKADRSVVWVSTMAGVVLFGVCLICASLAKREAGDG